MSSTSPGPSDPTPSFVLKNVTVDDTDSSLQYSQGWNRSASSSAHGGSFQSSDKIGEIVSFSLPANAIAVYCFGFKQTSGGLYEACLDCSTSDSSKLDVVDGHSDDTRSEEPTLLYQKSNLDPTVHHSLALLNVPDSRFGNQSTITLDSFVVTVRDEQNIMLSSSSSSPSASSTTSMSSTSYMAPSFVAMNPTEDVDPPAAETTGSTPSATASSSAASSSSTARGHGQNALSSGKSFAQKLRSPVVLTGVILATLFVAFTTLFAVMYFVRRRKRRRTAPGTKIEGHWAVRFFIERGREDKRTSSEDLGTGGVIGNGTARPKPPPVSQLQLSYKHRPVGPASALAEYPSAASQGMVPARTVPRSAFPQPPRPRRATSSDGESFMPQAGQGLVRSPSASPTLIANSDPVPAYRRAPSSFGVVRGPVPASGPIQGPPQNPNVAMNPYMTEAPTRVRDRTRLGGGMIMPHNAGPQSQGLYPFSRHDVAQGGSNEYFRPSPVHMPIPSTAGAWYEQPGPRPERRFAPPLQQFRQHQYSSQFQQPSQYHALLRDGSWGSR